MLNRCEAAWDEPLPVLVRPTASPSAPHRDPDGTWIFPVPTEGAVVLSAADGTETLVHGTDDEALVPDVVALAFRSCVTPISRGSRTARHAAAITDAADRAADDHAAINSAADVAAEPTADEAGDRTVSGTDLSRLLARRVQGEGTSHAPVTVDDDHTVLGAPGSVSDPEPIAPARGPERTAASRGPAPTTPTAPDPEPTAPAPRMLAPTPGATMLAATVPGQLPAPAPAAPAAEDTNRRPPVVQLVDAAGEAAIPLDAALVVGAAPRADSVRHRDARLVPVTGPTISRSHACLRVQSGVVLVCDLWSTNGTRVRMPGQAPFRLRDGEEVPVTPGTVVELGDGVALTVPSTQSTHGGGGHGA